MYDLTVLHVVFLPLCDMIIVSKTVLFNVYKGLQCNIMAKQGRWAVCAVW